MDLFGATDFESTVIPLVAIFCTIGLPMIIWLAQIMFKHQQRMQEMLQKQNTVDQNMKADFDTLASKMDEMKETLMDHAMSLDRNVEHLTRRVDALEQNRGERIG
ncbi:MAG: hypothetical protein U0R49_09500 [Fimbriimonadales bacterium]